MSRSPGAFGPTSPSPTEDHNVPTTDRHRPAASPIPSVAHCRSTPWRRNCRGVRGTAAFRSSTTSDQGIVHVVGPQLGLTQPGVTTMVCGDSHTSTHGAFGAIALRYRHQRGRARPRHPDPDPARPPQERWLVEVVERGRCPPASPPRTSSSRSSPEIGTGGRPPATSSSTAGEAVRALSMEGRMTVCNMSIEAGARAGLIAPGRDDLRLPARAGRPLRRRSEAWDEAAIACTGRTLADRRRGAHVRPRWCVIDAGRARRRSSPGAPTPARA